MRLNQWIRTLSKFRTTCRRRDKIFCLSLTYQSLCMSYFTNSSRFSVTFYFESPILPYMFITVHRSLSVFYLPYSELRRHKDFFPPIDVVCDLLSTSASSRTPSEHLFSRVIPVLWYKQFTKLGLL